MRCSWVGSEADIFSLHSEEADHETQRRTSVLFKKTHFATVLGNHINMWGGFTFGLDEKDRSVKLKGRFTWGAEKKRYAVENDHVSSFESSPFEHQLQYEKYSTETIQFELKVENLGFVFTSSS